MAAALATPGIDPRVWVSVCIVDKVVIDSEGAFADVSILSTVVPDADGNLVAQQETVSIAPDYAGNGFGLFIPPSQGDQVIVLWIDGHPDNGGVIVKRLWSASDPPPDLAKNNPADIVLIANKDVNIRIVAQGQGNIVVATDQGKVQLGDEDTGNLQPPPQPVARKTDSVDLGTWVHVPASLVGAVFTPCSLSWTPPVTDPPANPPPNPTVVGPNGADLTGAISTGSKKVEST